MSYLEDGNYDSDSENAAAHKDDQLDDGLVSEAIEALRSMHALLRLGENGNLIIITGGASILPVLVALRGMVSSGVLPAVVHIHYAERPQDRVLANELCLLMRNHGNYRMTTVVATDMLGASIPERSFSRANLERLCPDWKARQSYVCGPDALVGSVEALWHDQWLGFQLRATCYKNDVWAVSDASHIDSLAG